MKKHIKIIKYLKMINYLEILKESQPNYFNLTLDQIKKKLNKPSNKIILINDIKNFIFQNNYKIAHNIILNYLKYINIKNIDKELLHEYYLYGKAVSNIDILEKKINLNNLSNLIFKKLQTIIYINKSNTKIDYSDISDDFNNFYNYENNQLLDINHNNFNTEHSNIERSLFNENDKFQKKIYFGSEEKHIILYKLENTDINNEELENNQISYNIKKTYINKIYFKETKILFNSFSLPYNEKKILDFNYDSDILNNKVLTLPIKIIILERIENYNSLILQVQNYNQKQNNCPYKLDSTYAYKIINDKIQHYYVLIKEPILEHNCNTALKQLNLALFTNEKNIFDNYEFFKVKNKLNHIVEEDKNQVFYVFDFKKAFYSISVEKIISKINNEIKNPMEIFQFNILFNYFNIILDNSKTINFLPITKYSGILFKQYLKIIFKDLPFNNYLIYVDDFIIYGTKEEVDKTFKLMFKIIQNEEFSLSTFIIYDKYLHSKLVFLKQEFKFKKTNIEDLNKIQLSNKQLEISLNCYIKSNNEYKQLVNADILSDIKKKLDYSKFNIDVTINNENNNICEICNINIKNICLINCGHIFCEYCINQFKKQNCPYCCEPFKFTCKIFF